MPLASVAIPVPDAWLFEAELAVRVGDVNYGGHLGNDRVLGLAHEARVGWLRSLGLSEKDVGGAGLIMTSAALVFKAEAFLGDILAISLGSANVRRASFDLVYRMVRPDDGREIALIATGMVCFEYGARKVVRLPEGFARILRRPA